MKYFKTKLLGVKKVASETYIIKLGKPKGYQFIPGQYLDIFLKANTGYFQSEYRTLSIASSLDEDYLILVFRYTNSFFKKNILRLAVGTSMVITQAMGDFIVNLEGNFCFLAGGVGIAPFRSMILNCLKNYPRKKIILFYSNKTSKESAFLDELLRLEKKHNFKLIQVFTKEKVNGFNQNIESGYFSQKLIKKYINNLEDFLFYVAGPPLMVSETRHLLYQVGVVPQRIKTESFTGY